MLSAMDPFDLRRWPLFVSAGGSTAEPAIIDQVVIDSRRIASPSALFVALPGDRQDGHHYLPHAVAAGARYAIVNKAWIPPTDLSGVTLLRVDNTLTALQQIAAAYRSGCSAQRIAITGSRGKTMLKDLLATLVASCRRTYASPESFNSQIGVALSLLGMSQQDSVAIIEAGVSYPDEMASLEAMIAPQHVIITTIEAQHLATMGSLDTIANEKLSLAAHLSDGWLLAPRHPSLLKLTPKLPRQTTWWDTDEESLPVVKRQQGTSGLAYQLTFPDGTHTTGTLPHGAPYHLDLITIAVKAAWRLGVPSDAIATTLASYHIETMRTEVWHCSQGTTVLNSSYSADPQSVDVALHRLHDTKPAGRRTFLFGGLRRHHRFADKDLQRIGQAIVASSIDAVALYGSQNLEPLTAEIRQHKPSLTVVSYETLSSALEALAPHAKAQDTLLIQGPHKHPLHDVIEAFGDDISPNICTINLAAIASNIAALRSRIGHHNRLMVMVKALAYGTEDVRMAHFLRRCGIDILGVSFVDEAVNLKRAGVTQTLFALNALPKEARKIVQWGIEVGVSESSLIQALATEAAKHQKMIRVHLHIDTGMRRFGCRPEQALALAQQIAATPYLMLQGLMTHLTSAEQPAQDALTQAQYETLARCVQEIQDAGIAVPHVHAANSGGVIRHPFPLCNMARVGLAIFGLHNGTATQQLIDLKLAVSLTSRISGINNCQGGDTIGYGCNHTASSTTHRIAILPLGYFDGLHRQFSGKGHVLIHGRKAPMVGTICMDYMMVDISDIPEAQIGDEVLIFGHDEQGNYLAPEEFAHHVGSVAHEIISCLGPRVKRLFIYE